MFPDCAWAGQLEIRQLQTAHTLAICSQRLANFSKHQKTKNPPREIGGLCCEWELFSSHRRLSEMLLLSF
jgi:hypothetical protein